MLATVVLVALGVLNLIPAVAFVRPSMFERLYAVRADTAELRVVMRHRAVLLGCVGAALIAAAIDRTWLWPAVIIAVVSKASFLAVYALEGRPVGLRRVALADVVAVVCLPLVAL